MNVSAGEIRTGGLKAWRQSHLELWILQPDHLPLPLFLIFQMRYVRLPFLNIPTERHQAC